MQYNTLHMSFMCISPYRVLFQRKKTDLQCYSFIFICEVYCTVYLSAMHSDQLFVAFLMWMIECNGCIQRVPQNWMSVCTCANFPTAFGLTCYDLSQQRYKRSNYTYQCATLLRIGLQMEWLELFLTDKFTELNHTWYVCVMHRNKMETLWEALQCAIGNPVPSGPDSVQYIEYVVQVK